jgi:hypothetical protein
VRAEVAGLAIQPGNRRRFALATTVLVLALAQLGAPARAADSACSDPSDPAYRTHACKVERLQQRSFTVIAIVDNGINPYHVDFRLDPDDDRIGVHPSEYIEGYPAEALPMSLSFDAPSLAEAYERDAGQWDQAAAAELSWVDGTNIIGGHSAHDGEHFAVDGSHGTPVASQAAGRVVGPNHPDVLLVMVRSFVPGLEWAVQQPWVDVISGSWSWVNVIGGFLSSSRSSAELTHAAVAEGKTVCFATGNLTVPVWFFEQQGPSWHVNVGAEHADDSDSSYSGVPADVVGITGVQAADHESMTGTRKFAGTSGGTPAVCGLIAHTISQARARMGDTREGPTDGVVAKGEAFGGPSADGELTRAEIEDAVMATAQPSTYLPAGSYTRAGYGVVTSDTVKEALKVLFGETPRPQRPDEDRWIQATDTARNAMYGPPPD